MHDSLLLFSAISIVVLLVSTGVAWVFSSWFQRLISEPILALTETAKAVSRGGDRSARVLKGGSDEVGTLIDTFNEMLDQIQLRDAELRALTGELERRVAERTGELSSANEELESFSYSVAHDLRAPLRHIDGYSRMLLESYAAKLEAPAVELLRKLRSGSSRMGELIDDLLTLARIGRSPVRLAEVDLSELARGIADELRKADPKRTVEWTVADGLHAAGDASLLEAALRNLLGNAWKYTGKRPVAKIEFGAIQGQGRPIYFVRDNGVGFDMSHADKLFKPFSRLHTVREFEGTGIGLASAHRVIVRHGGRIWAESEVDRGATFYFTLWENKT